MKQMSLRESFLLVVVFLVAAGVGYVRLRYLPAQRAIEEASVQVAQMQGALQSTGGSGEISEIEQEMAEITTSLGPKREQLAALEKQFVRENQADALQELKVQISLLADLNGVEILESGSYTPAATSVTNGSLYDRFVRGDPYPRPLYRLSLASSYTSLDHFFKGLSELPLQVTIIRFEMHANQQAKVERSAQPLTATVILAL